MDSRIYALSAEEKAELIESFRKLLENDTLLKPDMIGILDIMKNATDRRMKEILDDNPWMQESDTVQ